MDESAARLKIELTSKPEAVDRLDRRVMQVRRRGPARPVDLACRAGPGPAGRVRWAADRLPPRRMRAPNE